MLRPSLAVSALWSQLSGDTGVGGRMAEFYKIRARKIGGEVISMDEYKGKVVLIENTASL